MKEIQESYFIYNGEIKEAERFNHSFITDSGAIYEVIRVIEGIPLFYEEHLDRLEASCKLIGSNYFIDKESIISDIKLLISINNVSHKNFKIVITDINSESPSTYLFFIESKYPTEEDYSYGVHTILYKAERDNPNAKVIKSSFREAIKQSLRKQRAYEALLVNQFDEVTEGSRSNIFIVKDNALYTSPGKDVLKGVTRQRIIDLCSSLGVDIIEQPITIEFLKKADGAFMTGTSPKVLPICSVDEIELLSNENKLILQTMEAYNLLIDEYINRQIN